MTRFPGPFLQGRNNNRMSAKKLKTDLAYMLFLLPALILFTLFFITPFLSSIYYSFTDLYGYNQEIRFIGLSNYTRALADGDFLAILAVTLKFTIFVVIIGNLISLILALIVDSSIPGRNVLRTVFFLPNLMSLIIVGFVWTFLYGDVYRSIISLLGNPDYLQISWLGNTDLAIFSIGLVAIWQSAGYSMIIYLAGLQNISNDLLESATIDGASYWKVLLHIKLPLLSPIIIMNLILATTSSLKAFDYPMAMTSGGPGIATTTVALYIYNTGFKSLQTGYGTAISVILFLIIALITAFLIKFQHIREGKI
jgi:raffinose/stachyose/melibiose transport system permease protein